MAAKISLPMSSASYKCAIERFGNTGETKHERCDDDVHCRWPEYEVFIFHQ